MSAIEDQLLKMKRQAEEREALRLVEQRGLSQFNQEELDRLHQQLTSLAAVDGELSRVDLQTTATILFLEIIIAGAVANRASDAHLETEPRGIKIRFRIDGILHDVSDRLPRTAYNLLLNRIKLLARLKLNIQNQSQDGRFSVVVGGREIEARVSVVPAEFGETVVLRLLDPRAISLTLADLGLRSDDLAIISEQLREPNGMILVTGPTGCGKTTTLYAFLKTKQTPEIKIVTIEDPIEYHLEGIEQTQASGAGYTFASGLRALVRQDPDVILVGEIRDKETAAIAIQAALTGHLVFSTVHTNNAAGAIPRLLDLEVKPNGIGPALNLVIAQRLVRRLCPSCRQPAETPPAMRSRLEAILNRLPQRVDRTPYRDGKLWAAAGCDQCSHFGYCQRIGLFELLLVDAAVEELINHETGEAVIAAFALRQGMVTMQEDGLLKAMAGVTTLEEVIAATGPIK